MWLVWLGSRFFLPQTDYIKRHSFNIENEEQSCVCLARLVGFPFFFTTDGLHKTPQFWCTFCVSTWVCAEKEPQSSQTGHTNTTLLLIFKVHFLCLNLGPSMVKKNGNRCNFLSKQATQTQRPSLFSMVLLFFSDRSKREAARATLKTRSKVACAARLWSTSPKNCQKKNVPQMQVYLGRSFQHSSSLDSCFTQSHSHNQPRNQWHGQTSHGPATE